MGSNNEDQARSEEGGSRTSAGAEGYLQTDEPIEHRSQDRLRRAPFAEAIAGQVIAGPPGHGLVIAITGKWGSGKTSVLRMVEEAVREQSSTAVLRFNPWLFSNAEQLVSRFLEELGAQLRAESKKGKGGEALGRAGDQLSVYAQSLEPFGWLPVVGPWLSRIGSAGRAYKAVRKARQNQPSAEQQRQLVREQLYSLDRRVLVVIDDLDRVEPHQIRDMVRLVKLVGDFPNTTYLLSYDREPVELALGATAEAGRVYLEKIVQVVHDLPEPPPEIVFRLLLEELDTILEPIDHGPFESQDWQNMLPDGIRPFFSTIRDVRRYLNTVPVTLRVVGTEVALVDVLALEVVRVFAPAAYAQLPESVEALTGESRVIGEDRQTRDKADSERVTAIPQAAGDYAEPTKGILRRLFPNAAHHFGGFRISGGEQRARRDLRVADPAIFRTYLQRALPEGEISGTMVRMAAESLGESERLSQLLNGVDGEAVEGLIERLEDYEDEYDPAVVEPALSVLLNQLPRLREGRRGMMDFGVELVLGRVVLRLMRRIEDETERLAVVDRVLPKIGQLSGRMELIDTVGHRENVGHKLVGEDDSKRLYRRLHDHVEAADLEQLAMERGLVHLFVRTTQEDEERGTAIVRKACADDAVLLQLLRAGLGEQRSQTMGDYAVRRRPSLPWELYEQWLGEEQLRQREAGWVLRRPG